MSALLFSPTQAAIECGLSRTSILRAVRDGSLAAKQLNGRIRITADALADFVSNLPDYKPGDIPAPKAALDALAAKRGE